MGSVIKVFIAEDQTMVRELLMNLLATEKNLEVIGSAANGLEAVRKINQLRPDLLILDAFMPGMNAVEVFNDIRNKLPKMRVLIISAHENASLVRQVLELGIHGFVEKSAPMDDLLLGVRKVAQGEVYFGPKIRALVRRVAGEKIEAMENLTNREKQIVKMIAESKTTKEIAYDLEISIKTVENHRTNLMAKLKLRDIAAVTRFAIEQGMVQTSSPR
ncbi:MAG: response regulator transcription factor [Verrucomicrobiae bacterium]|nr:response regulator transcription factor [Verrucomicrobiae bacterium]